MVLSKPLLGLIGAISFAAGAPAFAQEEAKPLPDFENMSVEEAYAAFSAERGRWARESCEFGVPLLAVVERYEPDNLNARDVSLRAQAFCAADEERHQDGIAIVRQLNDLNPDEPATGLMLFFAEHAGEADLALATVRDLQGPLFEKLTASDIWRVSRTLSKAGRGYEFDTLALSWFDEGQIGFIDSEAHSGLALRALRSAAKVQRPEIVDQLLGSITSPSSYIELLTTRDFEPFWPQIEERAGPNLEKIGAENVRQTRNRLANAPRDRD